MSDKYVDPGILAGIAVVSLILLAWAINGFVSVGPKAKIIYEEDYIDRIVTTSSVVSTTTTTRRVASSTTSSTTTTTSLRPEEVACFSNFDCGFNGTMVTKEYTCYEGNIHRQYVQFRCSHPGTREAVCLGTQKTEFLKSCGVNEHCIEGDQYCAYALDVSLTEADWVPENSTLVYVNNNGFTAYKGYVFQAEYVVSELDRPKRLAVDVIRPGGYDNWEYIGYNKGTRVGNITAGIKDLYKDGYDIRATIWVLDDEKK
jgi:hypothetical protein